MDIPGTGRMDNLVVRPATSDDYDAIVRISKDIYEGYDYLPDIYFACIEDPNRCAQVAEWRGEIVSIRVQTHQLICAHGYTNYTLLLKLHHLYCIFFIFTFFI